MEKLFMSPFRFNEKYLSQIPALQVLMNLGYTYLPPEAALNSASWSGVAIRSKHWNAS